VLVGNGDRGKAMANVLLQLAALADNQYLAAWVFSNKAE
jgi:hypothetical protein